MGFRAITNAAMFLFSSIVAGYLSIFYLKPLAMQSIMSVGSPRLSANALGLHGLQTPIFPTASPTINEATLWIGLVCLLGALALFALFYRTLKQIPEPR